MFVMEYSNGTVAILSWEMVKEYLTKELHYAYRSILRELGQDQNPTEDLRDPTKEIDHEALGREILKMPVTGTEYVWRDYTEIELAIDLFFWVDGANDDDPEWTNWYMQFKDDCCYHFKHQFAYNDGECLLYEDLEKGERLVHRDGPTPK